MEENGLFTVQIKVGGKDIETLKNIFANETDFQPQSNEDALLVAILRQVVDNPKTKIE
jgi:hypothetical protein